MRIATSNIPHARPPADERVDVARFVDAVAGTPGATWLAATGEEQPDAAAYGVARDEPRVSVAADVATPYGPLGVATTHLSFLPWWNARQLRLLIRSLETGSSPLLTHR